MKVAKVAETGTGVQIVKAEDYAETFPLQYTSYMQNDENSEVVYRWQHFPAYYLKSVYQYLTEDEYFFLLDTLRWVKEHNFVTFEFFQ